MHMQVITLETSFLIRYPLDGPYPSPQVFQPGIFDYYGKGWILSYLSAEQLKDILQKKVEEYQGRGEAIPDQLVAIQTAGQVLLVSIRV